METDNFNQLLQKSLEDKQQLERLQSEHKRAKEESLKSKIDIARLEKEIQQIAKKRSVIEGFSPIALFYLIIGKKKQRLVEIQKASERAQARFEVQRYLSEDIDKKLAELDKSIEKLGASQEDYTKHLLAKKAHFESHYPKIADSWLELEIQQQVYLDLEKKCIEAVELGDDLVDHISILQQGFANSKGWVLVNRVDPNLGGLLTEGQHAIVEQLKKSSNNALQLATEYHALLLQISQHTDLETLAKETLERFNPADLLDSGWRVIDYDNAELKYLIEVQKTIDDQNALLEALKGDLQSKIPILEAKIAQLIFDAS